MIMDLSNLELLERLGIALAIGLLIGTERGWHKRTATEGSRVAGIRTFGLISLLGGISAVLSQALTPWVGGLAFLGFALLISTSYWVTAQSEESSYGVTTEVAALIAFGLGLLAVLGHHVVASAVAVITAVLLGVKIYLHEWLRNLRERELFGVLKLLLISVVILPILPNQGYGPWEALNPFALWWMVVLVSGISFVGYFAMKYAGAGTGIMLTGMVGGLASSTAVSLSFSRMHQANPSMPHILAAGILAASAIMFPRALVEVAVVNQAMLGTLVVPLGAMTVFMLAGAFLLWRRSDMRAHGTHTKLENPFEIGPALRFGALLAAIMLLAEAMRLWFGESGLFALAFVSGIADVDAITLSLAQKAGDTIDYRVASQGVVIATLVNTLVKAGFALFIGGRALGLRVGAVALVTAAIGATLAFVFPISIPT